LQGNNIGTGFSLVRHGIGKCNAQALRHFDEHIVL